MSTATDGELLRRISARDARALEEAYDRYAPYVTGVAVRILRSRHDAEEVVQDVFWKLWRGSLRFDPARGRLTTWLFAVARNGALDRLRRRKAVRGSDGAEDPDPIVPEDPEHLTCRAERGRKVQAALAGLPEPERRAIELAFFEACSHTEIAQRTGEPIGTIKSRIRRGTLKLRDVLRETGSLS